MPKLIVGSECGPKLRADILSRFLYRWTVENEERARVMYKYSGGPPTAPLVTDEQWLAARSFFVTNKGELAAGHWNRYARSAADAEMWALENCHVPIRKGA